jgi:hypothetical protein
MRQLPVNRLRNSKGQSDADMVTGTVLQTPYIRHLQGTADSPIGHLVHQGHFTIFVLGFSDKSVPLRECHAPSPYYFIVYFPPSCHSTNHDQFINLQNCSLFHLTDIGYGL